MELRCTVSHSTPENRMDLIIQVDPGAAVGQVLDALPVPVGDQPCFAGDTRLDPGKTVADSPLVQGCVIRVGELGDPSGLPDGAVAALRAVAGPDMGAVTWLPPGQHVLGREEGCLPRMSDPDVAERHLALEVGIDGTVRATELSTGTPVQLEPGAMVEVGGSRIELVGRPEVPLDAVRGEDGRLVFERRSAAAPTVEPAEVALPAPVAANPVLGLLTRSRRRRDLQAARDAATQEIARHVAREERARRELAPDEIDVVFAASGASERLWSRDPAAPHGLTLRMGSTQSPASLALRGEPWEGFAPPVLRGVPATVDLREAGVVGLTGQSGEVAAAVRWMLVQLATLRSPADLRLVVLTASDGDDLAWTAWLPHVSVDAAGGGPACRVGNTPRSRADRLAELGELLAARRDGSAGEAHLPEIVVLLDGAPALRDLPGVPELLRDGPSLGMYAICAGDTAPSDRGVCCEVDAGRLRVSRDGADAVTGRADLLSRERAEGIARSLAPMREALADHAATTPTSAISVRHASWLAAGEPRPRVSPVLPTVVRLDDLPAAVPGRGVAVGVGGPRVTPFRLDMFGAGPHVLLVSGPAGSGRSTAAATIAHALHRCGVAVLALAPARSALPGLLPPDRLVRVLVGSGFEDRDLRAVAAQFGERPYAMVVDDIDRLSINAAVESGTELPTLPHQIADPAWLGRAALVLCGDALPVLNGQRPSLRQPVMDAVTTGTRILLAPSSVAIGREHGFTFEADQLFSAPPGRGFIGIDHQMEPVQLAMPPDPAR
ncbi:hypothetical protein [Phytohabitans aurantiacus]|uniref:AAA+ ATPase domain-containing protein n=1 Tax=Phytohabitans aurantiacus TaxID=3016789 RepID=A0ABQ5QQF1_9ACTN|nr:hypothetical protein [Phytohabitans aurantiacus]GLH96851.1 hypothetical protein Pa4123_21250 [Phytohabitans aurantiacus]